MRRRSRYLFIGLACLTTHGISTRRAVSSSSSYGNRDPRRLLVSDLSASHSRRVAGRECYHRLYANHRISAHNVPCKLVYGCLTSYRKRWLDIVSVLLRGIDISCTSSPHYILSKVLPSCAAATSDCIACSSPLQCGWPQTRSRIALSARRVSYCAELIVFSARSCRIVCPRASASNGEDSRRSRRGFTVPGKISSL